MSTTDGPSRSVLLAAVLAAGAASGGCTETSLHVRVEDVRQVALESAYPPGGVFVPPGQEPSRRPLAVASFWPSPDRDVVAERRASGGITLGSWDHLVADDGWLEPVVLGDSGEAGVTDGRLRLHYSYGLGGGRRYLRVELTTPVSNVSQLWQRRGPDRAMAAASIAYAIVVS